MKTYPEDTSFTGRIGPDLAGIRAGSAAAETIPITVIASVRG